MMYYLLEAILWWFSHWTKKLQNWQQVARPHYIFLKDSWTNQKVSIVWTLWLCHLSSVSLLQLIKYETWSVPEFLGKFWITRNRWWLDGPPVSSKEIFAWHFLHNVHQQIKNRARHQPHKSWWRIAKQNVIQVGLKQRQWQIQLLPLRTAWV